MARVTLLRRAFAALLRALCALLLCLACLPGRAVAESAPNGGGGTALADGSYVVGVSLEGGSGRASVESPAQVVVRNGRATATITWSSPNYDYMVVLGERYLPVNEGGNSSFSIPVVAWDEPFAVIGDTTAMSEPHEIEYQLTFHSGSAKGVSGGFPPPLVFVIAAFAGIACVAFLIRRRKG